MRRIVSWLAVIALVAGLLAGCSSSSRATVPRGDLPGAPAASATPTAASSRGSGPVSVLYAGSLVDVVEKQLAPGFHAATGYTLDGFPGGSSALASEIKAKVRRGDVFISASRSVNATLEGAADGGWVSWYATFARSPLVLGYNPSSRFASAIRSEPWYQVLTKPGILVGRTDPATDPKGKLTVTALDDAASLYHRPGLVRLADAPSNVFPEETLVGRLQAGQLDAGFFYSSETTAASLPSVPVSLPGRSLDATYTVTVLSGAPDLAGAEAFVSYLLGPQGRAILGKDGFEVVRPPVVSGGAVPSALRKALAGH